MSDLLHFEDFPEGRVIALGPRVLTKEEVISFASEFDPQVFHLDEDAAKQTILGGLCTSGWHTVALVFRMMADAFIVKSASLGSSGLDEARWLKPVYAGETLTGSVTITEARRSSKNPLTGIVKFKASLLAGNVEKCVMSGVWFVKARAA